jgi:hypothetical protein
VWRTEPLFIKALRAHGMLDAYAFSREPAGACGLI